MKLNDTCGSFTAIYIDRLGNETYTSRHRYMRMPCTTPQATTVLERPGVKCLRKSTFESKVFKNTLAID
jgi:hypothetical protein